MERPTGSVSDRHGWEWSRLQASQEAPQNPPAPDHPTGTRNPQQRIEQLEQEVRRLRQEVDRQERRQAAVVRQYERRLAEKNRQLDEQSESGTLVGSFLDSRR